MNDLLLQLDINKFLEGFILLAVLIANIVASYFIGLLFSIALMRLMTTKEVEAFLIRNGAMTSKLWKSMSSFITQYLKWYLTFLITIIGFDILLSSVSPSIGTLKLSELSFIAWIFEILTGLLWFIVLTSAGLIVGGIVYKVMKEAMDDLGVEEQMKKHRIEGAFGGIHMTTIVAGILKWYLVLLFMNEGTLKLNLPVLSKFFSGLVKYVPEAMSGIFILMVSMILARFTSERIKNRNLSFGDIFALGVECTIIFFGIVLSLPVLVENLDVSVLTDSFKILVIGVSLGLSIALGLGLKDHIAALTSSQKKEI